MPSPFGQCCSGFRSRSSGTRYSVSALIRKAETGPVRRLMAETLRGLGFALMGGSVQLNPAAAARPTTVSSIPASELRERLSGLDPGHSGMAERHAAGETMAELARERRGYDLAGLAAARGQRNSAALPPLGVGGQKFARSQYCRRKNCKKFPKLAPEILEPIRR